MGLYGASSVVDMPDDGAVGGQAAYITLLALGRPAAGGAIEFTFT